MNPRERRKQVESEAEAEGMTRLGHTAEEDTPDWIRVPERFRQSGSEGEYTTFNGDNNVYKLISDGGGGGIVYRQLKSEYYETTNEKGTCPNCQSYVKRQEGDKYLTCHRCGWQYKQSITERVSSVFK